MFLVPGSHHEGRESRTSGMDTRPLASQNALVNIDGDHRQHPRFRLPLRVTINLPSEEVVAQTVGISRTGLSVRLSPPPALEESLGISIELPNGSAVLGRVRCRAHMPGCLCGMSLELEGAAQAMWDSFLDEEESTGALWRMIGRIAESPDDALAPRGVTVRDTGVAQRFHTTGENALAWRVAFARLPTDPADESDLCVRMPGFREPARRLVRRVLREDVTIKLDAKSQPVRARVVELNRGGYAWVQGDDRTPVGLMSLGIGELVLVAIDGKSTYPHFSDLELEQIACDTFRHELSRPMFSRDQRNEKAPPPVPLPPLLPSTPVSTSTTSASGAHGAGNGTNASSSGLLNPDKFRVGLDAVLFAQTATDEVQTRRYGERDLHFHPSVWAKVVVDGDELMGPTLQDKGRVCVLALVGPGAPRVVKLDRDSEVTLLKRPKG